MISPAALLFPASAPAATPGSLPADPTAPERVTGRFAGLLPGQSSETPAVVPDPETLAASEALAAGLEAEIAARLGAEPLPLTPSAEATPQPGPEGAAAAGSAPEVSPDPTEDTEQPEEAGPVLASSAPPPVVMPAPQPAPAPAAPEGEADPAPRSAMAALIPATTTKPLAEPSAPATAAILSGPRPVATVSPPHAPAAAAPPRKSATPPTVKEAMPAAAGTGPLPESDAPQGEAFSLPPLPEAGGPRRSQTAQPAAAPTAPQTASTASPLLRNVMERLEQIEQSEGRTRLLLRPQGLGILEIEISRLTDGRLQMAIRAENPMILQSLQQEAGALNDFLGARGFDMAGGGPDLGRYSRPGTGSGGDEAKDADSTAAESPETPVRRDQRGPGLIDITT